MAMTKNQLAVIEAITKNDMPAARRAARVAVAEDTSKKNEYECKRFAKLLDPVLNPDLIRLPYKVEGLLQAEHPRETFLPSRYYLSPREANLFNHISRMRNVCDALAEKRINYPNTTLLYGPSGTGKTTFGRYIACMFDLPFYYLNFSSIVDSLLGKTSENISRVFDYIRTEPCVFMLDEIDCVSTKRCNSGGAEQEFNRVTITIMQELDKISGRQIIIGATNRIDVLDDAIIRRFSKHHEVTLPQDEIEASRVIKLLMDDINEPYDREEIIEFCRKHDGESQAWLMGRAIEALARSIDQEKPFTLEEK